MRGVTILIATVFACIIAEGCAREEPVEIVSAPPVIRGRIAWVGDRPSVRPIHMTADPAAHAAHGGKPVPNPMLLIGQEGGVANVVVWISGGLNHQAPPGRTVETHAIELHRFLYQPRHVTMRTTDRLLVFDRDRHHAIALPMVQTIGAGDSFEGAGAGVSTYGLTRVCLTGGAGVPPASAAKPHNPTGSAPRCAVISGLRPDGGRDARPTGTSFSCLVAAKRSAAAPRHWSFGVRYSLRRC